jgi:hypothetical protein
MAYGSVILPAAWLAHNRYWHSQRECSMKKNLQVILQHIRLKQISSLSEDDTYTGKIVGISNRNIRRKVERMRVRLARQEGKQ